MSTIFLAKTMRISALPSDRDELPKLDASHLRLSLVLTAIPIAGLIIAPLVYLAIWAFWGTGTIGIISDRFTTHWLFSVASDSSWQAAFGYSGAVAIGVSVIGSYLIALHFYTARFLGRFYDRLVFGMVVLMLLIPSVIYAIALETVGSALRLPELILLFCGHLVIVVPIQFFVFETAQENVSSDVLFAGTTLGASHSQNFRTVFLPQIKAGLWNTIIVGFFLSFDEVIIASLVINSSWVTVPKRLWDRIGTEMDPVPAVISLLVFLVYLIQLSVVALLHKAQRRR